MRAASAGSMDENIAFRGPFGQEADGGLRRRVSIGARAWEHLGPLELERDTVVARCAEQLSVV